MGIKGKVDAIGNSAALDTISKAKGDGTTVMMFHDMTFLSVLFGSVDKKYALENLTVGPRIGQNPGGCFGAAKDAPYKSLSEVTKYLKANPDKTVSFNIESGATSHLAFVAYYLDVKRKEGDAVQAVQAIVAARRLISCNASGTAMLTLSTVIPLLSNSIPKMVSMLNLQ